MSSSQQKILEFCLKNAIFDGWNQKLLENASISAGLDAQHHRILFPGGVADLFTYFVEETNRKMAENVKLDGLKTHEKIRACIIWRLEEIKQHKQVIKSWLKALLPQPLTTLKASYSAVDAMWRLCGDTATDFNFYSKRAILAGVYGSGLLYFIEDSSEDDAKTWVFLNKSLQNVGKFSRLAAEIKSKFTG
jgi:ubiquinone biosynthesis protein COQ9